MAAGTIDLTNSSATVTGTSTTFTTELKTGDFLGVIVGGVPYTLVVLNIASDTSLTIGTAYTGPTSSELAWYAVPATLQVAITQKVLNDVATMTRGMILDKDNWQQFYTGEGDITINLPDTSPVTGPSWPAMQKTLNDGINGKAASGTNSDITELKGLATALTIAQGGTGAKTAKDAFAALISGSVLPVANGGTGATSIPNFLSAAGFANTDSSFTVPCNGRNLMLVASSEVVTTNAAGQGTITYKQAFPGACITCIPVLGDRIGTSVGLINYNTGRTTSFDYQMLNGTAAYANQTVRINYIAIGY